MTPQDAQAIPAGGAADDRAPGLGALVLRRLEADAARRAFSYRDAELSCGALRREVLELADRLGKHGLRPGEPVALEIGHSFDLAAGMCAVLVAGGCAVPIDPGISAGRRDAIRRDLKPRLTLRGAEETSISVEITETPDPPRADGPAQLAPGIAFIVYTSGSSGNPKGVALTTEGYLGRLRHIVQAGTPSEDDVDLAWTPSSFIGMLDEIFYPLLSGIPSVIAPAAVRSEPRALARLIARERVTAFRITPSLLGLLLRPGIAEDLAGVRRIYCSGETIAPDVQRRVHEMLPADLFGFYGATEAPGVGFHLFDRAAPALETTICLPQAFADFRIVGEDGAEMPPGESGEIWIGGLAVARGYWRNPELTAEKFIDHAGAKWYRSGDLGRWLDGGGIEIIGRRDMDEVNVHGTRVSLPSVRTTLRNLPEVAEAWVSLVPPETGGGDPSLVGHCVTDTGHLDTAALKAVLADSLPTAAVPRFFMPHSEFPLTDNGKLDVRKLAADAAGFVAALSEPSSPEMAPRPGDGADDAVLATILDLARAQLNVADLSGGDNFFARGGTSLMAVEFALTLGTRLGQDISATTLFNARTFQKVAEAVASGPSRALPAASLIRPGDASEPVLLTINSTPNYIRLADHLTGDFPIYNLSIFGLTDLMSDRLDSFELSDLVHHMLEQAIAIRDTGHFQILAYCQDGCLAVELARQLQERPGTTCELLLIDTFFENHRTTLPMRVRRLLDVRLTRGRIARKIARLRQPRAAGGRRARAPRVPEKRQRDKKLHDRFFSLFLDYRPAPWSGPVTLFVSREWRHVDLSSMRRLAGPDLPIVHMEGLHDMVLKSDGLPDLARTLNAQIAKPRPGD